MHATIVTYQPRYLDYLHEDFDCATSYPRIRSGQVPLNFPSGCPIGAHPCNESALIGDPVGGIRWPCSCTESTTQAVWIFFTCYSKKAREGNICSCRRGCRRRVRGEKEKSGLVGDRVNEPLTLELRNTRNWLLGANKHQNIGILHSSIRLILGRQFVRGITMR
jgi:hypothetical protein